MVKKVRKHELINVCCFFQLNATKNTQKTYRYVLVESKIIYLCFRFFQCKMQFVSLYVMISGSKKIATDA